MERDDKNKKEGGGGRGFVEYKAKGLWDYRAGYLAEDTISGSMIGGFSWPPRSYTCSFCKRDFRSAQALGGHMNVHRRDRAMLRQSPPWVPQSSNPNPSPNPDNTNPNSSTSIPTKPPPPTSAFHTSHSSPRRSHVCLAPPPSSPSSTTNEVRISEPADEGLMGKQTLKELFNDGNLKDLVVDRDSDDVLRRTEIISLDLEIGLRRESKDELDLELRLGYA